jgi:hypothetical protein
VPSGVVLWLVSGLGRWENGPLELANIGILVGGLVGAGLTYGIAAKLLGIAELDAVLRRIRSRFP